MWHSHRCLVHASQARVAYEKYEAANLGLSEEEMGAMAALDQGKRYNDPGAFCTGMGAFCPIYD